ncbi:MAG: response regulator transcription factor [Prevotellaceae bacterium]|nr:response regulator transcription factor [Prevotellaceae bacterium]
MAHILLAEDEENIASFISRGLTKLGYTITVCHDGEEAWQTLQDNNYFDLLVLDIIMPKMNGIELCRRYRESFGYQKPVIMLTALGSTEDIVRGLENGAEEYLTKPFSFIELATRIKAMLRRNEAEKRQLVCADLTLDLKARIARRDGKDIELTAKEFRLLEYFMHNKNTALSRLTLMKDVWDMNFDTNTNIVDVYVNYLRGKIDKGYERKLIQTVIGVGYIMKETEDKA